MKKWDNGTLYATEKVVIEDDSRMVIVKTYSIEDDVYHDTYISFPKDGTSRDAARNFTIDRGMKLSHVVSYLQYAKDS